MNDASLTLREARSRYFAANGLPDDGGYEERWVKTKLGPVPFAYPNTEGRRRIAPAHDLHHVLTGYGTDLTGEGELGAWEIGAGCRDRTGLQLQLRVLGFALAWSPGRMFRAFLRGRRSHHLLDTPCDAALLERSVGSARDAFLGPELPEPDASDRIAFTRWALLAVAIVWGPLLPLVLLLWWFLG